MACLLARVAVTLAAVLAAVLVLGAASAAAATITVNTTSDTHCTGFASQSGPNCSAVTDSGGHISLRSALEFVSTQGGTNTISLPAGTYNLSLGDLVAGIKASTNITVDGAGSGTTTINQTQAGRMLILINYNVNANVVFELDNVTMSGGTENENDPDGFGGNGGTILAGGSSSASGNAVTLSNDVFSGNYCSPVGNAGCTGGAISMTGGGDLTVSGSTFSGNTASKNRGFGGGGAIYFDNGANGGNVSITDSTFMNNTANGDATTGGVGGAVYLAGGTGSTYTVTNNTFTGNGTVGTGGPHGGAIYLSKGTLNANFNRIVGNTSADTTSTGLYVANNAGSVGAATNNWWGCNGGPSAAPCDTAVLGTPNQGGSMTVSPWIVLSDTPSPTPIAVNQTTTLTADFLHNSSGGALTTAQISTLIGLPVTWGNASKGTLSGSQTTIAANGTATSTFTASAAGAGHADATVDNGAATANITVNKADTTTSIFSELPDPSVTGQPVTVAFHVTSSTGSAPTAPSGSVTVSDGTNSCAGSINGSGDGSCSVAFTSAGAKSLTATYSGDANFNTSSSSPATAHTVNKADTTTSITSDGPDPSVVGQSVTVHFGVSVDSPGAGSPTGNVTVSDGTQSCTGTAAAGQCSITFSTAGAKSLTATYAGDTNFNGSGSAAEGHTVNQADTTTSITSDTPDPSGIGEAVTVNYSVGAVAPGAGTATGNVTVSDGVDSCTGTVAAGTCDITLTTSGARTLTASYAGDSNFNGSTSASAAHTVSKVATTTSITSDSPDPSVVGQSVTVHYSVSPSFGGGTPTGNVTVSDGVIFCTGTVAAGQCTLTFASAGARTLTATYGGDATFNGSGSATESHAVDQADSATSITSESPDPSVVGQSVAVSFTVAATAPGAGTPTGNVTVSDGTQSCTALATDGGCTITFSSAGAKSLTASYVGDSNFHASSSSPATAHTVNKGDTTTSINSDSPDPSTVGQAVGVHYSVAVSAPGAGTPTGNVTVSDGVDSCTGTVAAGSCNITLNTAGARSLTASYAGDAGFGSSTSAGEPHTVDKLDTTTSITSHAPDPSVVGQSVTVDYTVTTAAGTPTGTVTVSDGVDSCTGTVAAGTCNISLTTVGARSLTASYAGDATFSGSSSAGAAHTVNQAATTTLITSDSPDPSVVGQSVTVHFSVSPSSGGGTPTGNVTVSDGVIFCTGTVAAGQCTLTFTSPGARSLTATYAGDAAFTGSSSATESHAVNQADSTTSITSHTPDPSVVGQSVTFGFAVAAAAPGTGTPTGNVTVSDGTQSCTALATDGQCTITFASAGAKSLTASYAGDANFHASSSSPATAHTVNQADTTTSITSDSPDPSTVGQAIGVHYSVAVRAPGAAAPTGNVTVSDGVDSCTGTVAAGTCNITLNTGGARTLTATYAGDSGLNGSTSGGEPHTVDKLATTTSITSDNPDPSTAGQSVTVDYAVIAGAGTPTGNVTVSDGVDSCTGTVAAGACSITLTAVGAGSLTASYAGDAAFSGSTSAGEPHTVNGVADLRVAKTDDVGGHGRLASHWTWKLHVTNAGTADATFTAGQPILLDNLPGANLAYGPVSVSGKSGISGAGMLACAIASNSLTCSAKGGPVTIGAAAGAFDVTFTATPALPGSYANPRSGGICQVDPGNQISEASEANNHCSDTVSVPSRGGGGTVGPPRIALITPTDGGRYIQGRSVKANYRCRDPHGAPGIASCAGTVRNGAPIDTAKSGKHTFTVTATSRDGQKRTRKIHYIVLPSNHFVLRHIAIRFDGTMQLQITLAGPGDVDLLASAPRDQATRARVLLQPPSGHFVYARAHRHVKRAGTIKITLTPGEQGRRLLARDRAFTLTLTLAFTPTHGTTRTRTMHGLTVRP